MTSQLWANLYLDKLDHFIKEELKVQGYARYTDDFLLWSDDKIFLRECKLKIKEFLEQDRLELQEKKTRIIQCCKGVPFLGFRFFTGVAPRIIGECKRRFEKRVRKQTKYLKEGVLEIDSFNKSVLGWTQFANYANVTGLFMEYRKNGFG